MAACRHQRHAVDKGMHPVVRGHKGVIGRQHQAAGRAQIAGCKVYRPRVTGGGVVDCILCRHRHAERRSHGGRCWSGNSKMRRRPDHVEAGACPRPERNGTQGDKSQHERVVLLRRAHLKAGEGGLAGGRAGARGDRRAVDQMSVIGAQRQRQGDAVHAVGIIGRAQQGVSLKNLDDLRGRHVGVDGHARGGLLHNARRSVVGLHRAGVDSASHAVAACRYQRIAALVGGEAGYDVRGQARADGGAVRRRDDRLERCSDAVELQHRGVASGQEVGGQSVERQNLRARAADLVIGGVGGGADHVAVAGECAANIGIGDMGSGVRRHDSIGQSCRSTVHIDAAAVICGMSRGGVPGNGGVDNLERVTAVDAAAY